MTTAEAEGGKAEREIFVVGKFPLPENVASLQKLCRLDGDVPGPSWKQEGTFPPAWISPSSCCQGSAPSLVAAELVWAAHDPGVSIETVGPSVSALITAGWGQRVKLYRFLYLLQSKEILALQPA